MTYQEFKNKYNGKVIDYDGAYGGQCWDLAEQYITECLGLPESILAGCGLVNNMLKEPKRSELLKYFDEVKTTAMYAGDLVIWEYGHIAIFDHWDNNSKKNYYFTQNPGACNVSTILGETGIYAFRKKQDKTNDQLQKLAEENKLLKEKLNKIKEISSNL